MWLFDNIFLDKDTPTVLLDNPEIKSPDGTKKPEATAPYDPKNDPIAPAVDGAVTETSTASSGDVGDVSFDIGWDLDFSLPEALPESDNQAPWITDINAIQIDLWGTTPGEVNSTPSDGTGEVSSIAMIQWGTASMVDGIDIGWVSIDIPAETSGTTSEAPLGAAGIEIHSIEEHTGEANTQNLDGSHGIFGLMGNEESPVSLTHVEWETVDISSVEWEKSEVVSSLDSGVISLPEITLSESLTDTTTEKPLDIMINFDSSDTSIWTGTARGGRIQELIQKLIGELQKLDEEEKAADLERQKKIVSISEREAALEHEYITRKEALKYERSSLEMPSDKATEKNRIKSLITSFEEDLG